MAFAGMFLGTVFLILIIVIYAIALIELIVGIVLLIKKRKVPGIVLLVLSALPAVVTVIVLAVVCYKAEYPSYDTYDGGTVSVRMEDARIMKNIIRSGDMEGLDEFLDKHPELIYYQDNNHETLLEYGLHDRNVEIMQIAMDHGAKFDAEPTFRFLVYSRSLENFFDREYQTFVMSRVPDTDDGYGVTTDEMIDAARFAVEHGADTSWDTNTGHWTFADSVELWINGDNEISDKDGEFLEYARSVS